MDINKLIREKLDSTITDKMPEMIEKHLSNSVNDIIQDLFRWGDLKDTIKKKISEKINVNLDHLDLTDYNVLISNFIKEKLVEQVNLEPINNMISDVIGFVNKKEISLQEIANFFIEASQEDNSTEDEGEITFIVKENETNRWIEIFADIEKDKDKEDCAFRFIFSTREKREGIIFLMQHQDWYEEKHHNITPLKLARVKGIEAKLFRIYNAQVVITDFNKDIDTSWCRYE